MAALGAGGALVEYVDVEELDTLLVATTPSDFGRNPLQRYTHCELHACSMFSMASSIIPLLHHNNAAYNSLALAQTKQAVGVYAMNFANRFDVAGIVLNSPQLPLVTSTFAERMCDGRLMHGENLIVAVASYTGYNQDDGCILNADSAMRGMFNVTYYHTLRAEEDEYGDEKIVLANPYRLLQAGKVIEGLNDAESAHLDEWGLPRVGTLVREGMVICGKVHCRAERSGPTDRGSDDLITQPASRVIMTDRSVRADRAIDGMVVDRVFSFKKHATGQLCAKIRLRRVRTPELGDKLASRFAQKGVVGMLLRRQDMPFTASGTTPDIILNPNAFPKRMTVGHLLDCILSKACAMAGTRVCHNPFEPKDVAAVADVLQRKYGLDRQGDEVMYCGTTGAQMQCAIFVGPTYTGRLKHMVADKMNYRDGGPVNFLTRQPTKGRGKHGGLRVGEMEEHVLLAHGAAAFLKESFMERSDAYATAVNAASGTTADVVSNPAAGVASTLRPDGAAAAGALDLNYVAMPYAFKLMQQELQAMAIDMRLMVRPSEDDPDDLSGTSPGDSPGDSSEEEES